MKSFKSHLEEKKLTPAEKKKREEIAKAMERENPDMPMDKKMAIATATAKRVAEAKATKCGRCGTTHVPPEEGGTCPALSKAENEKRRQKNEADAKDVASRISRYVLTTTGTGTTNAKGQKIVYDPDGSKSTAKK